MPRSRSLSLSALILLVAASSALAQTGADLLVRPFAEDVKYEVEATGYHIFDGHTDIADADYDLTFYEARGRIKEDEPRNVPRFGFDVVHLDLNTDDGLLPERLTDVSVAMALNIPTAYGFKGGIAIGVGYAGDGPFGDPHAYYGKATIGMSKTLDEYSDLGIGIEYDGNRTIFPDVPLPGFAYRRQVDKTLILVLGVPVTSIEWKPNDRFTFLFEYLLTDRFDFRVDYRVAGGWNVFASLDQRRLAFEMDELPEHDRLLFEQRRVEAGLRWEARDDVAFIVAGGYAFGQAFETGFDFRETDEVAELSDEPYARIGLDMRF